jgi:hypothetical protein
VLACLSQENAGYELNLLRWMRTEKHCHNCDVSISGFQFNFVI